MAGKSAQCNCKNFLANNLCFKNQNAISALIMLRHILHYQSSVLLPHLTSDWTNAAKSHGYLV